MSEERAEYGHSASWQGRGMDDPYRASLEKALRKATIAYRLTLVAIALQVAALGLRLLG